VINRMKTFWEDINSLRNLPVVSVDLMCRETENNDPFFKKIVQEFYDETQQRHKKFPVIKANTYGVALCQLPKNFEDYFMSIEAAGRRNFKKAKRNHYSFRRINFNEHLIDIRDIRQSSDVRQGKLSDDFLNGNIKECQDPETKNTMHDYAYFGIFRDERLVAYAGCFIAGELCDVQHICGHTQHHSDGVVPMLIIHIAKYILDHHPCVKYYSYGTFFGAGITMRRFKRKFCFIPHKVQWILGDKKKEKDDA